MAGFSDFLETKVLDHVFGGTAYTAPTTLYVALYTAAPTDSGGGTEVSGGAYARQTAAFNVGGNTATNAANVLNMLLQPQTTELLLQWVFLTPLQAETYLHTER